MHGLISHTDKPGCKILTGGVSNTTLLVSPEHANDLIVKQALAKLNVKEDWFSEQERIFVEARALEVMPKLLPEGTTPALIFEDHEEFVLIMEAISPPYENWKSQLLQGNVQLNHIDQFARLLALLHSQTFHSAYYANLFRERKFFNSLRLEAYYRFTADRVPEAREFLLELIRENDNTHVCLVHGDFSPKNVLVHHDKLILLDFEVMHFGDGAFDIGFAMTHLLSKANHLTESRRIFINAARRFWETYYHIANIDADMEARAVRNTLACLLARAKGKSPLEYLSEEARDIQMANCLKILPQLPRNMKFFIDTWERQ